MRNKVDTPKNNQQPELQQNNKDKLNKSSDDFLDIMNEEKPKEVSSLVIYMQGYKSNFADGAPKKTDTGIKTEAQVRQLVKFSRFHVIVTYKKSNAEQQLSRSPFENDSINYRTKQIKQFRCIRCEL